MRFYRAIIQNILAYMCKRLSYLNTLYTLYLNIKGNENDGNKTSIERDARYFLILQEILCPLRNGLLLNTLYCLGY